jgi:hypothetical protein
MSDMGVGVKASIKGPGIAAALVAAVLGYAAAFGAQLNEVQRWALRLRGGYAI